MSFDLSNFKEVGEWLFNTGRNFFGSVLFDFGSFKITALGLLIGFAVLSIVAWFLGKIFD